MLTPRGFWVALVLFVACYDGGSREALAPRQVRGRTGSVAQDGSADAFDTLANDVARTPSRPPFARNVILFVGDGMGFAQVEAARRFANGNTAPLTMETLPAKARMSTVNAFGGITDSAAGATAFATGHKVANGVIAVATPGNGRPLPTALELRQALGAATGLVTRETPIVDATPAAFAAHRASRYLYSELANEIFRVTKPDFLAGEATVGADNAVAMNAGYIAITNDWVTQAQPHWLPGATRVAWLYDRTAPPLSLVTAAALDFLSRSPGGFFLLVENEGTDTAGHAHDLKHVVQSVLELDAAVAVALAWMGSRTDTLVIVTADHETGALSLGDETAVAGALPSHMFGDTWHTAQPVPVFATGVGAAQLPAELQNSDMFRWLAP